ncbi:MAG: hypothetical protein SF051_12250 [Elusimicrobiota bacterium]|nr:hypothetical protein [Elusimicrobiota bacterium]
MDLFGLKKKAQEAAPEPEPAPETAPEAAPAPRGSHRLWAFLLVLDSVFVVVFAGAVAAKIYQHWRAPAPAAARTARRPVKDAPKPAETPAPAPAPAPTPAAAPPEPPKEVAKEAPKPAPKAEPAPATGMRPPKPSLLTDGPKPRETPKLAGPGAAAAAPKPAASTPAEGARPRAKPVPFRVKASSAKAVELVGAFIVRGGRKAMEKGSDGVWEAEVYLHPGQYRYFFAVDKKKVLDPENPRTERGYSLLTVP